MLCAMQLRGGRSTARVALPQSVRPAFEEGVSLICSRWTALGLAVENEWGGRNSRQKADELIADAIDWFYTKKGAPPTPLSHLLTTMPEVRAIASDPSAMHSREYTVKLWSCFSARPKQHILQINCSAGAPAVICTVHTPAQCLLSLR